MANITWFITGASRGLGLEIAKAAFIAGHNVIATARSTDGVKEKISASDHADALLVLKLDVTEAMSIKNAVNKAREAFGNIDILVNNAGYGQLGSFETISADAVQRQFNVNVFGLMEVSRAVLPLMRSQERGHIFNIASIAGAKGYSGASIYCASKFAVEGYTESLAGEVAPFGIKVTIVEPGFFRTDFLEDSSAVYGDIEHPDYENANQTLKNSFDEYSQNQPGDPAKLAQAVLQIAQMQEPPLYFAAGSDALETIGAVLNERKTELQKWETLSSSTDF
jgi:NAD(P)-dependent dehydrogenase (short-subunit alcohol dehydrogenase family)